ncbi:Linear gramicidin dehydrogenase LgrE [Xanthomonas sp. GW]|uniref:thioesterase II family protein n=1 Tax=Xanthomonas sp. GW TaxID=2724121 RepID=UPI00186159C9|nr:alpha/beta fold hydrolase [Xanthomonas sp. GW]QNH20778.1 Linear gramicidin dehydrogenase LgrE [Xanthomonas sp. GW]
MRNNVAIQSAPWLIKASVPDPKLRLFCFPYAGGNAFNYNSWRPELDPSIEICAVQLPGRAVRINEPPITSMPELLRQLAPVVAQQGNLPFAFFGHSVGGLIAFELARYLWLHDINGLQHLIVSGCHAPQFRNPSRKLSRLPDDEFISELRDYNGTPAKVLANLELMNLLLPTIRADFALAEDYIYRPGPLLQMPISVFAGREEDNKGPGQVDGWMKETTGPCQVTWFDGGHFFVNSDHETVVRQVNAELIATKTRLRSGGVARPDLR